MVFASDNKYENSINENAEILQASEQIEKATISVNWYSVGWRVLCDLVEKLINLDGSSEHTSGHTTLVSPSIEYNTGDMGNEFYVRPQVTNQVGSIIMHGHRVIAVDIFSKINLVLSGKNNDTICSAANGTNQYMTYTKKSSDASGSWKAQFISADTYKWQCYYTQYYNADNTNTNPRTQDGFYFADNNRVFRYSDDSFETMETQTTQRNSNKALNLTELSEQFINPADSKSVDNLKDYNEGDTVRFSDTIVEISYDEEENVTTFYFNETNYNEKIGWKFNDDLTDQYSTGDLLQLKFEVVKVGEFSGHDFESLDYFEEAFNHKDGEAYPILDNYQ